MAQVLGAQTNVHYHPNGAAAVTAAAERARNTTIVIGADQDKGALLIDIDVQGDVCGNVGELKDQLRLVLEALDGRDPMTSPAAEGEAGTESDCRRESSCRSVQLPEQDQLAKIIRDGETAWHLSDEKDKQSHACGAPDLKSQYLARFIAARLKEERGA